MSREVELKLEVAPEHSEKLRKLPLLRRLEPRVAEQKAVYFDTRKGKLRRGGWTLRVRESGGRFVQTIKRSAGGAGLFDRDEWESEVDAMTVDVDAAAATPLGESVGARDLGRLEAMFEVEVERSTWQIENADSAIELVSDRGQVSADGRSEPFHEIELELKRGDVPALTGLASSIARRVPVRLGVQTKSERGFALAKGKSGRPSKAAPVVVDRSMRVADGFATIAAACLAHFRLNEPLVAAGGDPEALHQVRVALRRLRSAFSLFKPAIEDEDYLRLREELRQFTARLGPARDLDVFLEAVPADDRRRPSLERKRARAYAAIRRMFASRHFRGWMLAMVAWVHAGHWRQSRAPRRPLMELGLNRLDRLWRAIAARGEMFDTLSEEERHRLRIDGKKIRYALEFFEAPLRFAADDHRVFAKAIEGLQEELGALNDLATARALAVRVTPEEIAHRAREERRLTRMARRHWATLRRIGPFWRAPTLGKSSLAW